LALEARRVVVVIEPIALYHQRDLHDPGDGLWVATPAGTGLGFGEPRAYGPEVADLVIATYGNGLWLALRAARRLERETGRRARVLDLRWLAPLPERQILDEARKCGRLLAVDECRRTGNVSEALAAAVLDAAPEVRFARVAAADSFIPLGDAANLVLVSEEEIVAAARRLVQT
jgi:2-oxoisovalerate dehydrogenase E1 component